MYRYEQTGAQHRLWAVLNACHASHAPHAMLPFCHVAICELRVLVQGPQAAAANVGSLRGSKGQRTKDQALLDCLFSTCDEVRSTECVRAHLRYEHHPLAHSSVQLPRTAGLCSLWSSKLERLALDAVVRYSYTPLSCLISTPPLHPWDFEPRPLSPSATRTHTRGLVGRHGVPTQRTGHPWAPAQ